MRGFTWASPLKAAAPRSRCCGFTWFCLRLPRNGYESSARSPRTNPADPYMTLLGYFNSLRELGGARRLIEDEVRNRLAGYSDRKRSW